MEVRTLVWRVVEAGVVSLESFPLVLLFALDLCYCCSGHALGDEYGLRAISAQAWVSFVGWLVDWKELCSC